MLMSFLEQAVILLLLVGNGSSTPAVEYDKQLKYEEYIIEHEISSGQAKNAVLTTSLQSMLPSPGCQQCTFQEKQYCLGRDLINDHCCCDKRYHEVFPFIPHTCYLGNQLCTTVASNCEEYFRLSTCCCKKFAFLKWKEKSNSTAAIVNRGLLFTLILFVYKIA